jgi:hypothetical protein
MASYSVNPDAVRQAERLIDSRQYVLDSDWGEVQPKASEQNAFLERHSWEEYARWHLGLTDGAADQTKARYAFVYGDFRRVHRMGIIACMYRAAEWRHKEVELAAHELLQRLDKLSSLQPLRIPFARLLSWWANIWWSIRAWWWIGGSGTHRIDRVARIHRGNRSDPSVSAAGVVPVTTVMGYIWPVRQPGPDPGVWGSVAARARINASTEKHNVSGNIKHVTA